MSHTPIEHMEVINKTGSRRPDIHAYKHAGRDYSHAHDNTSHSSRGEVPVKYMPFITNATAVTEVGLSTLFVALFVGAISQKPMPLALYNTEMYDESKNPLILGSQVSV